MASRYFGKLQLQARRTEDLDWEGFTVAQAPLVIAADDVVRFKLSQTQGGTPILDLDTVSATVNGSVVTVTTVGVPGTTPASGTVRLGQGDTADLTGPYYGELLLVDNSETNPADAIKVICYGEIVFTPTATGDVGVS